MPSAAELVATSVSKKCIFCENSNHRSEECESMSVDNKKQKLRNQGRCFLCLQTKHMVRTCQKRDRCIFCKRKHNSSICSFKENLKERSESKNDVNIRSADDKATNAVVNTVNYPPSVLQRSEIFLQTAAARIVGEEHNLTVRCLFDGGSQRTFISKDIVDILNLQVVGKERLIVHSFQSDLPVERSYNRVKLKIRPTYGYSDIEIEALETETISTASIAIPGERIQNCLKIKGLELADFKITKCVQDKQISLLIGSDNYWKFVTGKIERLDVSLVAVETILGWCIQGEMHRSNSNSENYHENEKHVTSAFTATSLLRHSYDIENRWKLDTLGIRDPVETKSRKEMEFAALNHFKETVTIDKDGRYEIRLPWIEGHEMLNTNLDIAKQRLISTTDRLIRRKKYEEYEAVFEEWLKDEVIEEIPNEELTNICHYLPHRGVIKENSTTKLRPVFDASCRGRDSLSLNDCLEKGPNLLEQIPPILTRFRKDKIGVISDIKRAFLQISVAKPDRDFLRFLLWNDFERKRFRVLRHRRVVFGLNCSPFLLAAVLNYHLEANSLNFPKTVELLRKSFYVDNCVTSVPDENTLHQFIQESRELLASACFDLRGWENTTLKAENPTEPVSVLGLLWNKNEDTLFCDIRDIKPLTSNVTRRNVLSTVHKIFDPIGVLCPTTVVPKLLVQKSWSLKIGWDIILPDELQKEFASWILDLPLLSQIRIPRSLNIQGNDGISLHIFCDASKLAYSAVVYLRKVENDDITVQLVEARSRVAPLRKITIPRLELLACCIGARLGSAVIQSLNLEEVPAYYWTDSSTALFWIQREDHWGVFVRNRVKEIRMLSSKDEWRHVSGDLNAADLPSRGCSIQTLLTSKWWEGPEWLRMSEENWPNTEVIVNDEEIAKEKRKGVNSTVAIAIVEEEEWYLRYFSSYSRIIRMISWMLRFLKNCQIKGRKVKGELSIEELEVAEKKLWKIVQSKSLCSDVKSKDLFTFVDEDGIIRLKTKIIRRDDDENFRCPIVLPSNHELVARLIFDYHLQSLHAGVQVVLLNLRQRFWILRGRKTVQRVLAKCVRCKRHTAKGVETLPSPLPEDRIRDASAFEVTGVDVAGPIYLRNEEKTWILLFTCAVYRAVHLELIQSLSTNGFLLGLRRFIARRGRPSIIYSDNGTNFVGAQKAMKSVNWDQISRNSSARKIQWKFNPPTAAWWGGWWERLVQMVKKLLRRVLGKACLEFEEMSTILCDVEAVINSRPLTYISEDPKDLIPLSPSMFIQEIKTVGVPDLDNLDEVNMTKRWRYHQRLRQNFRKRFRDEYLSLLVQRPIKRSFVKSIKENDLVLVGCDKRKRVDWPMGRVISIYPGKDNEVRVVKVRTASGELTRPVQRIFPLEISSDNHLCEQKIVKSCTYNDTGRNVARKNENPVGTETKKLNKTDFPLTTRYGRKIVKPERYN